MKKRFARAAADGTSLEGIRQAMIAEAQEIHVEKRATDEAMGRLGAELMPQTGQVMTQCNAGALATAGIGSALGVIRMAIEQGHKLHVLVPETRPYLQGARLTAWELHQGGIPLTLITDNMVGHFLKTGKVGAVVVGVLPELLSSLVADLNEKRGRLGPVQQRADRVDVAGNVAGVAPVAA